MDDDPVTAQLLATAAAVQDAALQVRHGGPLDAKQAAMTARQAAAALQVAATELEHRASG